MVGKAMAIDMAGGYEVVAVDLDTEALSNLRRQHKLATRQADLSDSRQVMEIVSGCDLVIGAVPGFMGYRVLEAVISAGVNVVDISFFDQDPFELDELARTHGVTAVVDMGVAPGMDNVFLAYHLGQSEVQRFECLVGGLPLERCWPYEYKAPFSPIDVLEEYTRPARIVENGKVITRPALSQVDSLEVEGLGTLESFNSDGLRTLIRTCSAVPNMIERTLRYPGHAERMRMLRDTGFFGKEPIEVKGQLIRPIDLTTQLLFPHWKLGAQEEEFTVMRVLIEDRQQRIIYDLLDRFDQKTQTSSMARCTGYSATGAARLVLEGRYVQAGISPPEYLGRDAAHFEPLMQHLTERGVNYRKRVERL